DHMVVLVHQYLRRQQSRRDSLARPNAALGTVADQLPPVGRETTVEFADVRAHADQIARLQFAVARNFMACGPDFHPYPDLHSGAQSPAWFGTAYRIGQPAP